MYNPFLPSPGKSFLVALIVSTLPLLLLGGDSKKSSSSSSPPPASHPANSGGGASHPSNSGGSYHPSTSGTASHGATGGPTTTSHGPTTSTYHGATTNGNHGPTTSTYHGPTTSAPATRANTTNPYHPAGSGPAAGHEVHSVSAGSANRSMPVGVHETHTPAGNTVTTRPNGHPRDVYNAGRGVQVHHDLNGNRIVSVDRLDHSHVVADRWGHGYVERGYAYHGHDYARRSYYYHGRYYDRYYRNYYYRGYPVAVYAPVYYYPPAFYGWVYNPWPAPVVYGWGWAGSPWYGYYGAYFTPYPVYPSAAFWLTDYMISTSLAAAYQEQVDAQAASQALPAGQSYVTPEIKQMISDEVSRQIALENQEAQQNSKGQDIDPESSGIARLLADNQTHVFIAGSDLDVVQTSGQECGISQGDVLEVTSAPPADAAAATATVLCSKGGAECPKSSQVSVPFSDLQDMQNHMRENIDQGLSDLQSKQGQGGLPTAPPSAKAAAVQSGFATTAPQPEVNVEAQLRQTSEEADVAEQEVTKEAPAAGVASAAASPASASSGPVKVSEGQTIAQVTAALGEPQKIVDLGTKKVYVYPDMKVIFKSGKVSDVE